MVVCPPCFLVCPGCRGVSAVFWCVQNVSVPALFSGASRSCSVFTLFSGVSRLSRFLCCVLWCVLNFVRYWLLVCLECWNLSVLFSGVSRMFLCVRLVFWCVQNVGGCPPCFPVGTDFRGVFALFSGVYRMWPCVHLVFWWVQSFVVCPLCFLVCPEYLGVPALLSDVSRLSQFLCLVFGESRLSRCVRHVFWCPDGRGLYPLYSNVSRVFQFLCFVFWCVQTVASCLLCFLLGSECLGVSFYFQTCAECGGVSTMSFGISRLP